MPASRRRAFLPTLILSLSAFLTSVLPAQACTDFRLNAADGAVVIGRSMEWGVVLNSQIDKHPRGETLQSQAPNGIPGLKWTSKYGFVGVNAGAGGPTVDGLNEKGLSIGLLWLPGSKYQEIGKGDESRALSLFNLADWLLGSFATVAEAEEGMKGVKVWAPSLKEWGGIPMAHISLHDQGGKSLVFEFTDGELKVFANSVGVLTNAPTFDWQCKNLENYYGLTPYSDKGAFLNRTDAKLVGQGGGLIGMPGNILPASRFVHTAVYKTFAKPVADSKNAVNLAQHILNSVDIPLGVVRTAGGDDLHCDYTQWVLIKDLKNKTFHYRAYSDISLHTIQLDQLDFSEKGKRRSCPIAGESSLCDTTALLR